MAAAINVDAYSDALVILATAGVVVPVVRRFGINPVLGFLAAGALLGPRGLGSFIKDLPFVYWFTVVDTNHVAGIAELGIVFLLFLIGLELSFSRLAAMRRLVGGLGTLQIVASAAPLAVLGQYLGLETHAAIVIGTCLALSSTAIVIETLSSTGRLSTNAGRASFAVLLAQDIAVIPLLLLVGILASGSGSLVTSIGTALAQAAGSLVLIVLLGRLFLRPLFRLVSALQSPEAMMAAVLFVVVGAGFVAALCGVSMALGAFVAGLLFADTEYRKVVESIVEPFKGILLGIFFFTVGMSIDPRELVASPLQLALATAALIALKTAVFVPLARLFGLSWPASLEAGLVLAPGGEFAFVGVGASIAAGIVQPGEASFMLTAVALSMALIPPLATLGAKIAARVARVTRDPNVDVAPPALAGHAIVVGYGRVGKVVAEMLDRHGVAYIAVDADPAMVARDRRGGHNVYFGDATSHNFLMACGLTTATALIITTHLRDATDKVIELVRTVRPDLPIVVRAVDAVHARHLYARGATDAVPETIEASLQLSEATLLSLGLPMGKVIASIHDRRAEFRKELQQGRLS